MNRNPCKGWENGDPVTYPSRAGFPERYGKAIRCRRENDGRPFFLVQITGGEHATLGKREWPDGWVLGQGKQQARCVECGQEFRADTITFGDSCLACNRRTDAAHAGDHVKDAKRYASMVSHYAKHAGPTVEPKQTVSDEDRAKHNAAILTADDSPF